MEVGRQRCGGMWWGSFREPVIQAGKACQDLVSEKEMQKKEQGMLCFSELGLRRADTPNRTMTLADTQKVEFSEGKAHYLIEGINIPPSLKAWC